MAENNEELEQTEEELQQAEYDKVFYADEEGESEYGDPEAEKEEEAPEEEPEPEEGEGEQEGEPEAEEQPEDEQEDEQEGEAEEGEEEPEAEEDKGELVTLKWRGKEIKVTQEEAIAMAQQGFDATHKYQEVADLRKRTQADLDLMERAKNGDKQAIQQIIKQGNIDPVDLLDMEEYESDLEQGEPDQAEPFISPKVAEMLEEVSQDTILYASLQETEKDLPQVVIDKMAKDPETFYTIVNEVRSGDAEIVMPYVQKEISKLSGLDRSVVMGDIDAFANLYVNVKNSLIQAQQQEQVKTVPQKQKRNVNEIVTRKSGGTQRRGAEKVDAFSDDKAYQAILNRLEGNQ